MGQRESMRLLRAIHERTGGRGRAVRDITELRSGLSSDESRAAWHELIHEGLIERFSQDYAARLSDKGLDFIAANPLDGLIAILETPLPEPQKKLVIAHGAGHSARESIAAFAGEIDIPTVLLAAPERTIMEQMEEHADAGFALVLLTPDDLGLHTGELRPQMNVLMELGYFMGRLGRAKVCALAVGSTVALPSDLAGVKLRTFDAADDWQSALIRDLEAAGYDIKRKG